jgi:hypothetical protein
VFQNLENPATTCDEDAILWEERKEFILAITSTLFMYHYQSYSQQTDSNHSCFTSWLGLILNIEKSRNKGGAKGWDSSLPIVVLIWHLLNAFII